LSRRFNASISCAASSAISNAKTSHHRRTAPRVSVSFPVVPVVRDDGKRQRLGTARDVFSFGRAGWGGAGRFRRRGRARDKGCVSSPRATRARSGRTLVRDPASRARARRRPSAFDARRAKNDDADARQRMPFENARRVSRVPSLARPSRARARVRAFRLRCRPNARQPKPARRSHARCATYECRPTRAARVFERAEEFFGTPRQNRESRQSATDGENAFTFKTSRARMIRLIYIISPACSARTCAARSPDRRSTPGFPTLPTP